MRTKVGITGAKYAGKTVLYTFVWVAAKVAVLVSRGNNSKLIRNLGPRWVVALTKIFFAKYARYAYFHRIHQILKGSSLSEKLDIMRHHLGVTNPDLLVTFSMLKEAEPKDTWDNLRNYVDVRIKSEKNPLEQQRMVELGKQMDAAAKRGLGLGTLSFLGETSPFSATVTVGTLALIAFVFPQVMDVITQTDWSTLGIVGGGLTMAPTLVSSAKDAFEKKKENPRIAAFVGDLKLISAEMESEGKLDKDADSAKVLEEIEQKLLERGHNLEVMTDLITEVLGFDFRALTDTPVSTLQTP